MHLQGSSSSREASGIGRSAAKDRRLPGFPGRRGPLTSAGADVKGRRRPLPSPLLDAGDGRERMRRCARPMVGCIGVVAMAAGVGSASGHSLSIGRGTADVSFESIVLTLEVEAEDLLRGGDLGPVAGDLTKEGLQCAAARHQRRLLDALVIRDVAGEALRGRCIEFACSPMPRKTVDDETLRQMHVIYLFKYETPEPARLLTFQLRPSDGPAAGPGQWVLAVRSSGDSDVRVIRLTSRGNPETLSFRWKAEHAEQGGVAPLEVASPRVDHWPPRTPVQVTGDARFGSIHAVVCIEDAEVRCDVYVPLVLAETWVSVDRADRDFVSPGEFAAAGARLCELVASRNRLVIDGAAAGPESVRAEFLGPEEFAADGEEPRGRVGAWTARIAMTQRYAVKAPPRELELRWGLFNGAVLTAEATVVCGGSKEDRRLLTYAPVLKWSRGQE